MDYFIEVFTDLRGSGSNFFSYSEKCRGSIVSYLVFGENGGSYFCFKVLVRDECIETHIKMCLHGGGLFTPLIDRTDSLEHICGSEKFKRI